MGKLGSRDEEAGVDDPVVLEDRPWLPESSDPDISISESLSPKDDDSEESSTLEAIRTQNEVPKDNAKPNLTAKIYQNDKKENKGNPFLLLGYSKNGRNAKKEKIKGKGTDLPVKKKSPE
jgi:hypothetical protein